MGDEFNKFNILQAIDNTSICTFMYYPKTKYILIPEKTCKRYNCKDYYENMPYSFADDFVDEADYEKFYDIYFKIDDGIETTTCEFHSKDKNYCCRVTLTTVVFDATGKPYEVFGIIEDISESYKTSELISKIKNQYISNIAYNNENQEAINLIANAIGGQYYAIYHIWIKERTYVCFEEKLKGILEIIGEKGNYDSAWKKYIENYVQDEDKESLYEFVNLDTLPVRLMKFNRIAKIYKRKGIGFTRGQFIVAKRDETGVPTNLVYTVADVNEEMNREIEQKRAVYEAEHDLLTGVYNRNGFEKMSVSLENDDIGFALIDIDNFKSLNDNYGHEMGDLVLKEIADLLGNSFHNIGNIFRVGGDEFALLITNYTNLGWEEFCRKIKNIHHALFETLPEHITGTISVGLFCSDKGYYPYMYQLADRALYETKKIGRAGATLIGLNGEILYQWRDDSLSAYTQNSLAYNNTGLFRLEFDKNKSPRLICSEATKAILGVESNMTPEECFRVWVNGIEPLYMDSILKLREEMLKKSQVECTYLWNHPKYGKIYVRSGGYGEIVNGIEILNGYHHSLRNTMIVETEADSHELISALSDIYFATYYIDLLNDSYSTFKYAPGEGKLKEQDKKASIYLKEFVNVLVSPQDRKKMLEFVNLNTLPARFINEKYLDCEYYSLIRGWCRARFISVKYDENNRLTNVLFAIATLNKTTIKELEENRNNKKSIETLYDNVPGGIVMYEWDGKKLKTLHISRFYNEIYGQSLVSSDGENKGGPDFMRVHPDDVEDYKKAIYYALTKTHKLEYVYRVWNNIVNHYIWIKVNAVAKQQEDGTLLVYAMYSDVNEQKEAEMHLEKSSVSLEKALNASNQLCYEYDPFDHTGECYTDTNFFNLPKKILNYPDSLLKFDLFHPADAEIFLKTAHEIDNGKESSHCDVRIKKAGKYTWYSCTFNSYFDAEKERNVAILTVVDISLRVQALSNYEDRIHSLLSMNEESLCVANINLSKNIFVSVKTAFNFDKFIDKNKTFDELLIGASKAIVGAENQKEYLNKFNRLKLLENAQNGIMHVDMRHLFKVTEGHSEWIEANVDLLKDPISGDVMAICYAMSIQESVMSQMLLRKTLEQDYPMAAVVFSDTNEYYLYDSVHCKYGIHGENYWPVVGFALKPLLINESFEEFRKKFDKDRIIDCIKKNNEYSYAFDGMINDKINRLEIKFSYLDDDHNMILVTLRNITDGIMLNKLRHESEYDALTGLYNRNKVFKECRHMLDENPDINYAMLHFNIKQFHLYNTFFGHVAGDKLLCDIADIFKEMGHYNPKMVYGRIEADVFCIFFPFNAVKYEEQVIDGVKKLKEYRDDFIIEASMGLYRITDRSIPVASMFNRASIAAKSVAASQTAVKLYTDSMEQDILVSKSIVNDMQAAIDEKQFVVYIQPKFSLRTNKAVGGEALVRWIHPKKGLISPGVFVPIFERNGFIANLDRYMWEEVCILLKKWKDEGREIAPISVNVSRVSIYSQTTVQFLKDLVSKYDIDPKYLELELTETAYMDDPEEVKSHFEELQKYGFKILMDDFGSGYSSLNTLKDLPVDCLKLDMKFLSISSNDERGRLVILSIIRMSKLLGLYVIAEGVEKEEQADFLRSIGCEYVQGYLFAKPMPAVDYEKMTFTSDNQILNIRKNRDTQLAKILTSTQSNEHMVGEYLHTPLAVVELREDKFVYIRANPSFIQEFDINDELTEASKVFLKSLSDTEYKKLIDAYKKCATTKNDTKFTINWKNENKECSYLGKVTYETSIGGYDIMIVIFLEI